MYFVKPSENERYYLRLLLATVPGATSYADLRTTAKGTPQEVIHATFKAACLARGLLQDDEEWDRCLDEAKTFASASQMRALFASLLCYNDVAKPRVLWQKYLQDFTEDLLCNAQKANPNRVLDDDIIHMALRDIERHLLQRGRQLNDFPDLPKPPPPEIGAGTLLVDNERARYDRNIQNLQCQSAESTFNPEQQLIYDSIIQAIAISRPNALNQAIAANVPIENEATYSLQHNVFFIDGVGGAGKTFLYNALLSRV
jgi:hypothetical protein